MENAIYDEIAKKLAALKNTVKQNEKSLDPMLNDLRNKVKAIELEENRIADTITKSEVNTDLLTILSNKASKLKSDRSELLEKIEELQSKELDTQSVINLSKKWKTASFEEKRGVCNILIDKIIIDENGDAEIIWNI